MRAQDDEVMDIPVVKEVEQLVHEEVSVMQGSGQDNDVPSGATHLEDIEKTSTAHAVIHIFKANVGVGVFLLPGFYRSTGAIGGFVMAAATGLIIMDSCRTLIEVKQRMFLDNQGGSYSAVVERVLGVRCRWFIDFSLFFTQCGFCMMYLQFASSLFASVGGEFEVYVALAALFLTPVTFFSHRLRLLAIASFLGTLCIVSILIVALTVSTKRICDRVHTDAVPFEFSFVGWIHFFATHILALEGIGVILPVENTVANPSKFISVVNRTLVAVTIIYVVFGQIGYTAFGSLISQSIITVLPASSLSTATQVALGFTLILSYPVQFVPAIQIVDRKLGSEILGAKYIVSRIVLNAVFACIALAAGSDSVNRIAGFLGSFVGAHLTIFFPTLLALVLGYAEDENGVPLVGSTAQWKCVARNVLQSCSKGNWTTIRRVFYLMFSLTVWAGGTILAIV